MTVGMQDWRMQDWRDAGLEGDRTGGEAGLEGIKDAELEVYRKGVMHERSYVERRCAGKL